MGGVQGGTGRN